MLVSVNNGDRRSDDGKKNLSSLNIMLPICHPDDRKKVFGICFVCRIMKLLILMPASSRDPHWQHTITLSIMNHGVEMFVDEDAGATVIEYSFPTITAAAQVDYAGVTGYFGKKTTNY